MMLDGMSTKNKGRKEKIIFINTYWNKTGKVLKLKYEARESFNDSNGTEGRFGVLLAEWLAGHGSGLSD